MGTIQIDGSTPKLTIGNATAEDATILFDGNAQDFYIALDDSADDLLIGLGSTVGSTPIISMDENKKVSLAADLDVTTVATAATFEPDGDTAAGDNAAIGYTASEGLILTGQGSTDDVTIKNDADATVLQVATGGVDVELTAGNLIIGTSGKGIDFSATGDTGGMTSELLDDYEEGTFTPEINFGGSTTGITYSQQTGVYTKIGNLCVASFVLILSDKGSQTGTATLAGFPFSVGTSNTAATNAYTDRITMTNGVLGLYLASGTTATLYNQVSGDNAVVTNSHFADNSFISGRLTY